MLVRMLPEHLHRAVQATAFVYPFISSDEEMSEASIPFMDPPSMEEIIEYERSYPNDFVDQIRLNETKKYIMLGSKGSQALATLFCDFDHYAFISQYAYRRTIAIGMFLPPFHSARRLIFEYLSGHATLIPMETHMQVADEVKNQAARGSMKLRDDEGRSIVDEKLVGRLALRSMSRWRLIFGTQTSVQIDSLINREAEELALGFSGPGKLILKGYKMMTSSAEFFAVDIFHREREANERINNQLFANMYAGTLYYEDVIYKTRRLIMLNGFTWLQRNAFLNHTFPFEQKVIEERVEKERQIERKRILDMLEDTSAVVIQAVVRGYLKRYRFKLAKQFVIKMQRQRRAAVWNRKESSKLNYAIRRVKDVSESLKYFFSWENLRNDTFLLNHIDNQTCTVSYSTLYNFNSIYGKLVGQPFPRDIIEMAARKIDFMFIGERGIGRIEWPERKKKLEKREQEQQEQQYASHFYFSPYHQYFHHQQQPVYYPQEQNYYYQ